ncbi:MAG: cytochrome c maturation protein CcmE [Dehalococcoidia bacterium]|nr:cytochrome c maturation protein CcmE [Dehalococcoidia bacterium]
MKRIKLTPEITLILVLLISALAISVLVVRSASSNLSYYLTPIEYLENEQKIGQRIRIAGRVVDQSITEERGTISSFQIVGDENDTVDVDFIGQTIPTLFGPYALVIVEGIGVPNGVTADLIIIKHENEFFAGSVPEDSISSNFVKPN